MSSKTSMPFTIQHALLGCAFATIIFGVATRQVLAQVPVQDANDAVATAQGIAEDPDCITEAIAGQAAAEGARRIGDAAGKMLGKIGINTRTAPAAKAPAMNPCKAAGTAAAAGAASTAPAVPPVTPPAPTVTRPRLGTRNSDGSRNCGALGAGCADGMKPMVACYDEKKGYLWKVLADTIEEKRDRTPGLTAGQLTDINADIAALRRAHAAGAPRVEAVDPARPDRYNSWLTGSEFSAAANTANTAIREHEEVCTQKYSRF
jgi:hypothetical protein